MWWYRLWMFLHVHAHITYGIWTCYSIYLTHVMGSMWIDANGCGSIRIYFDPNRSIYDFLDIRTHTAERQPCHEGDARAEGTYIQAMYLYTQAYKTTNEHNRFHTQTCPYNFIIPACPRTYTCTHMQREMSGSRIKNDTDRYISQSMSKTTPDCL